MRNKDDLTFFGDYFEWQYSKAKENIENHEISFEEAKDYEEKRDEFKEYGF